MNKKLSNGLAVILPNKKINLFVFFVIMLGIISGTIFLLAINNNDKELVINQITTFMSNVNGNNINNFNAFKNSLVGNVILVLIVWILGMSIVGIIFNIFVMYLRGFIIGFTLSSFFLIYQYKGLLAGAIYLVPTAIINIIVTIIVSVYSIMLTICLWKVIFMKDRSNYIRIFLKKYILILFICLVLILVSSLCEGYLIPALIKLTIKVFI